MAPAAPPANIPGPMPHITVKLHPGRTEQQKTQLTEEIVKDVYKKPGDDPFA